MSENQEQQISGVDAAMAEAEELLSAKRAAIAGEPAKEAAKPKDECVGVPSLRKEIPEGEPGYGITVDEFGQVVERKKEDDGEGRELHPDAKSGDGDGAGEAMSPAEKAVVDDESVKKEPEEAPKNEISEDGKKVEKVRNGNLIHAVLGIGSSRCYVYFTDGDGRAVVDREWVDEQTKVIEAFLHGEKALTIPVEVKGVEVEKYAKALSACEGDLRAAKKEIERLKGIARQGAGAGDRSDGEKEAEIADLRKKIEKQNAELLEMRTKYDNLAAEEKKAVKGLEDLTRKVNAARDLAAGSQGDRKRMGFTSLQQKGRSITRCGNCEHCSMGTRADGHPIVMWCEKGNFSTGTGCGCQDGKPGTPKCGAMNEKQIEVMLANGVAEKCEKCGKVVGIDEYMVNFGWCDSCMTESLEEYFKEHPEKKVPVEEKPHPFADGSKTEEKPESAEEKPEAEVENDDAEEVYNLPFGGKCRDCVAWHTKDCDKPMDAIATKKCSCYKMRIRRAERKALEKALQDRAEGLMRIAENRQDGTVTTYMDEHGERTVTTREEGEW